MSLSNTSTGSTYNCNGVTTSFAIPFAYQLAAEVKVYLITIADGTETLLTNPTNYSISGSNVVTVSTYSNLYRLRVERATALTQLLDLINNSAFLAEDLEETLDKIVQAVQEAHAKADKSLKVSIIDLAADTKLPLLEDDAILVVNPAGNGFAMGPTLTSFNADVAAAAASAAAALVSENNAAASAAAALSSQNSASLSAANAATAETNAETAETNAAASALAAQAAQAAAEAAVANIDTVPQISGDRGNPVLYDGSVAIELPDTTKWFNTIYLAGDGGPVTMLADPPVDPADNAGSKLRLIGCNNTNTFTMSDGTAFELNGPITFASGTVLELEWDGSTWLECFRNGL